MVVEISHINYTILDFDSEKKCKLGRLPTGMIVSYCNMSLNGMVPSKIIKSDIIIENGMMILKNKFTKKRQQDRTTVCVNFKRETAD